MKIVCDSCAAKYSIADEKVAGKVFKIRCKKCSAVIVVRGDQLGAQTSSPGSVAPSAPPPAQDAIWHVVVDGDQQGPFAPVQIGEMLSAGTIDWEAYVWREGFDGWLAARDVPELVDAITGQSSQQQSSQQQAAQHAAEPQSSRPPQAMGVDPFAPTQAQEAYPAQASAAQRYGNQFDAPQPARAHAHAGAGADLFGQQSQSPFDAGSDDDVVASQLQPRGGGGDQAMTGQRNENSVLFSLANLQALATGAPGGGNVAAAPASIKPGHAAGEGSGLIDIRALAATTGVTSGGMGAYGGPKKDNVDDLLSIGTGSPLGTSLGAPVLAPVKEEKSSKGLVFALLGVVGVVIVAAAAVIIVIVTRPPNSVQAANGPASVGGVITPGQVNQPPQAGGETNTTAETPTMEGTQAAMEEETETEGSEDTSMSAGERRPDRRDRDDRRPDPVPTSRMETSMTADPLETTAMMTSSPNSSLDDLLDNALNMAGTMQTAAMSTEMEAAPADTGGLPDTPPRDAVARGLRSVQGAVRACGGGQHGTANTTVTISGSTGRVTSAQVSGQFAGTPVGSCVARAVRGAQFPRFRRSTFTVNFPFSL
jgi:predicted Zn finger-like uncharacterized protein